MNKTEADIRKWKQPRYYEDRWYWWRDNAYLPPLMRLAKWVLDYNFYMKLSGVPGNYGFDTLHYGFDSEELAYQALFKALE